MVENRLKRMIAWSGMVKSQDRWISLENYDTYRVKRIDSILIAMVEKRWKWVMFWNGVKKSRDKIMFRLVVKRKLRVS